MKFETILQNMLNSIDNDLDKREGSIIYNALAPAAAELAQLYIELDVLLLETFADTATREFLIKRCQERGIIPYPATKAILNIEITPKDLNIPVGTRFSGDEINYILINENQVEAETAGNIGNNYIGDIIPINYVDKLENIKIINVAIPANDEEETEHLRTRYLNSFDMKAFGGNITDYKEKTNSLKGVGACKVVPTYNGAGTVKLIILDTLYNKASLELLQFVQEEIDPTKDGGGLGIAPIGHIVSVESAEEVIINFKSNITYDIGYDFETLKSQIIKVLENYFLEIKKSWENNKSHIIRIAVIDSEILKIQGVIDIMNTQLNGGGNVILSEYQIPKLGEVIG